MAPGVCCSRPRIHGHRNQVDDVAIWHEQVGMTAVPIVSEFPSRTLAHVHAALANYYANRGRIDADIEAALKFAQELQANAALSRLEATLRPKQARCHGQSTST
jgi:uncharacterized protein (DUF433 family)